MSSRQADLSLHVQLASALRHVEQRGFATDREAFARRLPEFLGSIAIELGDPASKRASLLVELLVESRENFVDGEVPAADDRTEWAAWCRRNAGRWV